HVQALLSPKTKYITAVYVMGIVPAGDTMPPVTSIRTTAVGGDFSFRTPDGHRNGALVGHRLAQTLSITPGIDSVLLLTVDPTKFSPVTGIVPHTETFLVTGLFETGMYEYDNSYVFVSLEAAQQLA